MRSGAGRRSHESPERLRIRKQRVTGKDDEFALNDKDVLDSVVEMILASFLTSSATLAWTMYHLARNRSVRERLEQEIDEVVGGRTPTIEDYDRLSCTRAAIAEALRLAPPVYFIGRTATSDCTIGDYFIPAGTHAQLFFFENQRDERYFPQPEEFRPERWLDSQPPRPRCSYMPFGSGTRDCAGEMFANVNLAFVIATIAQRWRLDLVSEEIPKFRLRAQKRASSQGQRPLAEAMIKGAPILVRGNAGHQGMR